DCSELMEKIKRRVNDWKNKSLSFAGRSQLIRSVLSSMHLYWASVFILPSALMFELEQVMRGFLWCQGDTQRGKVKVAWVDVCLPKKEGGLGIRRLEVNEIISGGTWKWPTEWHSKYHVINSINVPSLSEANDCLMVRCNYSSHVWNSVNVLTGKSNIPNELDLIVDSMITMDAAKSFSTTAMDNGWFLVGMMQMADILD
nr:reverse transcriptase domain, reverse transcriptase zinc-binding domain protein [Tanacetum cinerariifolium]